MKFELEMDEMNMVLALLNETPTKMGFYPICQKLAAQGNNQLEESLPSIAQPQNRTLS